MPLTAFDTLNVINKANVHVGQLNTLFKAHKSKINTDCIRETSNGITITTGSVAAPSDLTIIEQYFKGLDDVESNNISPRLPQSKSFLKILGIPYTDPSSASPINSMQIKSILTKLTMLKDITLASPPRVIRASKNSDMAVIWVDIWDSQNSTKAKTIINRSFNYGKHIATIRGTSMNPGVPQCCNCWK